MQFKQIELSMKAMVDSYRDPWALESSENTFTNLFIWGTDGRIFLAEHEDALFILVQFPAETPFMFAPIPRYKENVDYKGVITAAEDYFKKLNIEPRFVAVNGPMRDMFTMQLPEYVLTPDRGNFDYVYSMNDLLTLSGKKLHGKRNHINQFNSMYEYEYVDITKDMFDECMQVYSSWLETKDLFERGVLGELSAVRTILNDMDELNIVGGGIRVGGKLVAFSLGERLTKSMALIHIEKASSDYQGLYTVINQQFVEHRWTDVEFINREEDMGIEGMRRAKLSYRPLRMIEKFEAKKCP